MQLYKEYNDIMRNAQYLKDFYKKVYLIFEGKGGEQIITGDILPKNKKIREILIPNSEMEHALNFVLMELQKLVTNQDQYAGYGFYFAQYGGSKTQFLHMLETEADEVPNVIPILLEDLKQFQPRILFEKMLGNLFRKINNLPEFLEDPSKYRDFFAGLNELVANIQISFQLSKNLKRAEEIIENLWNSKNPTTTTALTELNDLLHSSIMVDNSDVLAKIIRLMQYCSQHGMIFLFLFDEVDLWLNEDSAELELSPEFLRNQTYMKQFLEIPDTKVHCVMVYACTDRVHTLLHAKGALLSARSPAGSRWVRIYENAEKILEPGNYGDQIDMALVKLAAYHSIYYNVQIPSLFFDKTQAPLTRKYAQLSRRNCNSKIIQLLKNHQVLDQAINQGLREWESNTQHYGTLMEDHLASILRRLNIKFVREQVLIDPTQKITKDKLDGYFVNPSLDDREIRTLAEIKLTKNFKGEKAYQVLQWLTLNPEQHIIFIIFSPTTLEEIKKELIAFAEKQNFDLALMPRIQFLHISDPYAFCAINAVEALAGTADRLNEFYNAFAQWLDFYADLSHQYQTIIHQLGYTTFVPPVKRDRADPVPGTQAGSTDVPPSGTESAPNTPAIAPSAVNSGNVDLSVEGRSCLLILTHMFRGRVFTSTGRVSKQKITALVNEKSLGISNIEELMEFMHKQGVISKITDKFVNFDASLANFDSLEKFTEALSVKLGRKSNGSGGLGSFIH
jgi:hypothetical protein